MFKVLAMTKDYTWQCFLAVSGEWDADESEFSFVRVGDGYEEYSEELVEVLSREDLLYLQLDNYVFLNVIEEYQNKQAQKTSHEVICGENGKTLRFPLIQLEAVESKDTDNDKDE